MRHRVGKNVVVVAVITTLLTSIFYLAHDAVPPNARWIGWQAYDSVNLLHSTTTSSNTSAWSSDYEASFPLDFYAPLLPNAAPITDIAIAACMPLTSCTPRTTPAEDALLGKWVRVERSLSPSGQLGASAGGMLSNFFGTIEQRFIFYRKSRRRDVQRVVEIQLVEQGQTPPSGDTWHRAKHDLRGKVLKMMGNEKNLHLYFRTVNSDQTSEEAITELDLVYGDNPPWPGFNIAGLVTSAHPSLGASRVSLSYRRKPVRKPPLKPLRFRTDGTFKILQLADLHFSVNPEPCRGIDMSDPRWRNATGCLSKNDTLALVDLWLDTEKPDMVVLTGDQLNGQGTSWDPRSVLSLYVTPLIQRRIPYAVILGNHDSESGPLSREEQMHLIQNLPYSHSTVGPDLITGEGNYYLKVESPSKDRTHLATLWFMDTGARAEKDKWKPWTKPGYGYIHKDQLQWFEKKFVAIKQILLPFRPDGAQDLPAQQWTRRKRRAAADTTWEAGADQGQTMQRPPSIVFMHIPVPEAFAPVDHASRPVISHPSPPPANTTAPGSDELIVGSRQETATFEGAQAQPGIFDLFVALNRKSPSAATTTNLPSTGVKMVLHGHMHNNSDCRRVNNIWICFGGGSSFAGYGDKTIQRRARVVILQDYAQSIRTYHRIDRDPTPVDDFVLPFAP